MNKLLFFIFILISSVAANAQTSTDSTFKHSPLKTLNDFRYDALMNGDDIDGMSLAGEMNQYPLPGKVLKFQKQLGLSAAVVVKLAAMDKALHRKKLEMGQIIIKNDKMLDSIFKYHILDNGSLIFYTNRYGLYQGEMMNAILQACLATRTLLSQQQINKYEALQNGN